MSCFSSPDENKDEQVYKPATSRGCTDVFWLALYIIFWLFMIAIAVFAFVYGSPVRLINGFDSFGNTCGVEHNDRFQNFNLSGLNMAKKPYVFFLDIKEWQQTLKICVESCPDRNILDQDQLYRYYKETNSHLCQYDFNMTLLEKPIPNNMTYFHILGPCPKLPVYESKALLHRCIPTNHKSVQGVQKAFDVLNSWTTAQQVFSDLYNTWPTILMMCFVAFVLSLFMIGMMGVLTSIISWLICIFAIIASIAITVVLWITYLDVSKVKMDDFEYSNFDEFLRNETMIKSMAIIATIIMIMVIVVVFLMRKKLSGLAALFEEASSCMLEMPSLVIPSILASIALALFLAFWVTVVVCLATAKHPDYKPLLKQSPGNISELATIPLPSIPIRNNTGPDYKTFTFIEYYDVDVLQNMFWFYLVGLIWTCEFIFACQQLALAGAVVFWYFRKPTDSPVLTAIGKLLKYHLGSAAKGSILITLFKIPRLILTYLYAKLKTGSDKGSECAQCCMKSCICCFWFLEKFIRFLNHNAYTVIAIENINFCPAAGVAWNAMMANSIQVATINGIGDFILFLGKLAVGLICGLISVLLLRHRDDVHFYMLPAFFIALFSFFIAHIILSLFEMVVDTLFLCVCEDRAINGSQGRYKESKLAHLVGEEPNEQPDGQEVVEETIRQVEMAPINRQPFSLHA
ncbi:CTL-like protein 1 [Contarinia nasturtii]|uniref:CTL-like protein 1 n=1 Tax=Contarinia nasturtii TaxID=265458 RepID=UPI0012D37CEC|nr:CTL-like protein 1 [Contarinia nasturtii]